MKQESNRGRTIEDIDGGLHPTVAGQSLGEVKGEKFMGKERGVTHYNGFINSETQKQ